MSGLPITSALNHTGGAFSAGPLARFHHELPRPFAPTGPLRGPLGVWWHFASTGVLDDPLGSPAGPALTKPHQSPSWNQMPRDLVMEAG